MNLTKDQQQTVDSLHRSKRVNYTSFVFILKGLNCTDEELSKLLGHPACLVSKWRGFMNRPNVPLRRELLGKILTIPLAE